MSICTALIIPADLNEPVRVETIDAGLEKLQTLVGGNIEAVSRGDWHFYLNEEGKILDLDWNRRAALLVLQETGELADLYCGNAVFLGEARDGGEGDVPRDLIDLAQQLFGVHRRTTA